MADSASRVSELLQASLDPAQNKRGQFVIMSFPDQYVDFFV